VGQRWCGLGVRGLRERQDGLRRRNCDGWAEMILGFGVVRERDSMLRLHLFHYGLLWELVD
jgi:hypothetical protein